LTRRQALAALGATGAALALGAVPGRLRAAAGGDAPGPDKMRLAFAGVGGRGRANVRSLTAHEFVAFADVDDARAGETYADHPRVPRYRDFREMIERHQGGIDGVVISTPDHSHHPITMVAMQAGLNVYVEKPLATTIWECRQLEAAARRYKVKAQLGVQGHANGALRVLREWLDAGAVGPVREVYLWTDRAQPHRYVWSETIAPAEPVPPSLDWDAWLCARPDRPYNSLYVPDRWRNWWDLGTGPIPDVGIHMFDALEFALELGFPEIVEPETPARSEFTLPRWSRVEWKFAARGSQPPVTVHWVNGSKDGALLKPASIPHLPAEIIAAETNGMAFVGDDGTAFIPDMRASETPRLFPLKREEEFLTNLPAPTLHRPKGGHFSDWFDAIRNNREPGAHFGYGAALTEVMLLGMLAQRTGKPIRWDREKMRAEGAPEVDALVRPPVRDGWEYSS
jgi:predicted dehydrogenase